MEFAACAIATLGPYMNEWRAQQLIALNHVRKALGKFDDELVKLMHEDVRTVAAKRNPANIAFSTVILRWPDQEVAKSFLR